MDAKGLLNALIAMCAEFRRDHDCHGNGSRAMAKGYQLRGMIDMTIKAWMIVYDVSEPEAELHVIERIDDIYLSLTSD